MLSRYTQHFRQNLILALPIMGGQLGQVTVNLADNIMVGKLGAASLAAVSLANSIFVVFLVLGFGLSFALPPLLSEAHGADEPKRVSQYFKHSLLLNVIYAFISLILIIFSIPILSHLGQDPEVVELARPYLMISAFSMIPLMIFQTFRTYSDGLSETIPPMLAIFAGNVINIALNYMFIYGKWGAPEMGVTGAALGSMIARLLMVGIIIIIIMNWKNLSRFLLSANYMVYQKKFFKKLLDIGIPSSLQGFFEISAFSGAALIMGMISKDAQAAHQIAINLASITFLIVSGFALAGTIRVGNQLGQKDYNKMNEIGMSIIVQIIIFMTVSAITFVLFRNLFPLIYIDDPEVLKIAGVLLLWAAIFQIPDGLQVGVLGLLRGLQDAKVPAFITFLSYWVVGIPISYITAITLGMGPNGVWYGLIGGLSMSAILLTYRFIKKSKKLRGVG